MSIESKIEEIKPQEEEMKKEKPLIKKEGVERLLSPDVKIGEIAEREKEIEEFEGKDFAFENKEQYSLFKKTFEDDKQFEPILKDVKKFLNESGEFDLLDPQKVKALRVKTKDLPLIEKYIALTYMGTEFGVKTGGEKEDEFERAREWWIKPSKEGNIELPYRISTWHYKSLSNAAIKAFSLDDRYTYDDEETALNNPLSDRDVWMELENGLPDVIAHYLRERGLTIANKKETKEKLYEKLKKDKDLLFTLERTGFSSDELRKILGAENMLEEYDKLKSKIETLKGGIKTEEKYLIKDGKTVFFSDFSGPSHDKGWDVRIRQSRIHIVGPNTNQAEGFKPYFKFEDFSGGQTYRYEDREIKEIKDFEETKENYIVDYLDGAGKEKSITIEKGENVIFLEEAEKTIGKITKEIGEKWLSSGNKEPIAMEIKKYGKTETKMGNYPHFITHKIDKDKAYMATVRVIDAERYDELLMEGHTQGVIFDPQLKTELYKIDLNTEEYKSIGSMTTNRNETFKVALSATEHDGKIEFVMKPEIRLLPDGEIGVNIKVRKGADWTNLTLYGKPVEVTQKEKAEK